MGPTSRATNVALAAITLLTTVAQAAAQDCPAPLTQARRLMVVTAATMNATVARLHLFERAAPGQPWRALGLPEPAVIGKTGVGWSHFHRRLALPGEPLKVEGDKRAPAGVYAIGRSFGVLPSSRPGYLNVAKDTVCVDDSSSPA